jgi:PAS domain S-box-containing protein
VLWQLTTKVPLRNGDGAIVGLIGISRNVSDRKQAEVERTRALARLQLQIERMPLAYLLTDANLRFVRWNPAAERIFGFTQAEVFGKHPFDVIVPPQSQPLVSNIFERVRAGDMDAHGEAENQTKDGASIICEWHNTPIFEADGSFAGLLSLAQDVTDRKNLENQLRQSQKMEAIGRLAGGVAHDFNNLLTIITGHSELLLSQPAVVGGVRESVTAINQAGERAAALTGQLLGFSRQSILQPKALDLNAVVAETSKMLHRLIGEDIEFATVLGSDLKRVKVDVGQLDQVLMNLAVNARDAMPAGGKLTIETANVLLSEDYAAMHLDCKAGPHVMLAITDTGSAMSPEVLARIFEPFFTTKGIGKGSGLGLAMVYGIVQQSEGCMHVYSEPGHGTTFKIYLPAVDEPTSLMRDADFNPDQYGTETILLVEDEEAVRALALQSLQMRGYTVLAAADGKQAMQIVQAHTGPLDLVLTDVVMPNIGGPGLVASMKPWFPHAKVLFTSGYTDDAVVRHGLLEADVAFIQKPYTPMALARKLRQVLDA